MSGTSRTGAGARVGAGAASLVDEASKSSASHEASALQPVASAATGNEDSVWGRYSPVLSHKSFDGSASPSQASQQSPQPQLPGVPSTDLTSDFQLASSFVPPAGGVPDTSSPPRVDSVSPKFAASASSSGMGFGAETAASVGPAFGSGAGSNYRSLQNGGGAGAGVVGAGVDARTAAGAGIVLPHVPGMSPTPDALTRKRQQEDADMRAYGDNLWRQPGAPVGGASASQNNGWDDDVVSSRAGSRPDSKAASTASSPSSATPNLEALQASLAVMQNKHLAAREKQAKKVSNALVAGVQDLIEREHGWLGSFWARMRPLVDDIAHKVFYIEKPLREDVAQLEEQEKKEREARKAEEQRQAAEARRRAEEQAKELAKAREPSKAVAAGAGYHPGHSQSQSSYASATAALQTGSQRAAIGAGAQTPGVGAGAQLADLLPEVSRNNNYSSTTAALLAEERAAAAAADEEVQQVLGAGGAAVPVAGAGVGAGMQAAAVGQPVAAGVASPQPEQSGVTAVASAEPQEEPTAGGEQQKEPEAEVQKTGDCCFIM